MTVILLNSALRKLIKTKPVDFNRVRITKKNKGLKQIERINKHYWNQPKILQNI